MIKKSFDKVRRFCSLHLQRDVLSSSSQFNSMLNLIKTIKINKRKSCELFDRDESV